MRADIHDGREHMLQSEAGYIDARPHRQDRRNLLHRTAGPYIRVRKRLSLGRPYVGFDQLRSHLFDDLVSKRQQIVGEF
jgi:hypothetical protein